MFVKTAPGHREQALPLQFVVDPAGWTAAQLAKSDSWIYPLSPSEIAELADAAGRVQGRGQDLTAVRREDFMLPRLGRALADIQRGGDAATHCGRHARSTLVVHNSGHSSFCEQEEWREK